VIFAGAVRISDALYNKGLAKIKVSDLSGAMDCLSRSISVNKNNTQARNLLGLVQYEMGHVGEALKNWVISCGLQRGDNLANDYIEAIQKNTHALERLNDAIRIYNQALKDLSQKSDDMAIIKLKQSIELNPKFVDALNLLTFCHMIQKDKSKAIAMAERVLSIDSGNTTALSYYNELSPTHRTASRTGLFKRAIADTPAEQPAQAPSIVQKKVVLHERRSGNFHLEGIIALVIGVVCTFAVMYVLVFPAFSRTWTSQVDEARAQLALAEQNHEAAVEAKDLEIAELENQIAQNEANIEFWAQRYDGLDRSLQILTAFEFFREDRIREAANAIYGIDPAGLPTDIQERADEIRSIAYPQLADQYYREGVVAYNASDFEKARVDFERAYRFAQYGDPDFYGEVIYYLAWTFSWGIDLDQAVYYFERLLNEFPEHNRINPAQNRLDEILDLDAEY